MNRGYIKFWRKAEDSVSWTRGLEHRGMMVTILDRAAWKPRFEWGIEVQPGEFLVKVVAWAETLGMSQTSVRRILKNLVEDSFISVANVANRYTRITVLNWHIYQQEESASRRAEEQPNSEPAVNQRRADGEPSYKEEEVKKKKEEEKNTNTQGTTGEGEPARACDASQGEFSDFPGAPGIEFQELRQFYDEHCRAEAPLTGFIEYKQIRASRRWPGISRICDAIDANARADPEGWRQFCPGLVKFLREHWWEKKPTARASPSRKKAGFDGTEADASARRVFEQRKAAREAENGGNTIQP